MKTVLILGILLLAANAGFNFNTDACQAEKYDNWDAVRFPIQGGSGDFDFNFEKLPQGWYANKDRVYIPKGKVQKNKYYSTKVTVFDKKDKQYLKRSLLLNYDNDLKFGRAFDADYDVDFDDRNNLDQFLNARGRGGNFFDRSQVVINQRSDAGSNIVTRTDYFIPSQPAPNQIVPNFEPRRDQYVTPSQVVPNSYRPDQVIVSNFRPDAVIRPNVDDDRRRNPYYDSFPGDDEIERVITDVDCSRIRDIINFVSQSRFGCKSRAQFLQKFQNKLQIKIAIFRTDAENNRQPIFGLQEQLKALKEQLEKINARPNRDSQSERVRGYRSQIERHERERAGYQNEYRNSKDSVERLRNEISGIRSSSSECRNGYDQQDRRIRQIEAKIAELEDKLRDLKNEKEQCRGRRDKHQYGLADSDRRIDQCNNKIKFHQDIIDGYEKKSRYCTDAINEFNKKIEDCNRQQENNGRENARDIKAKIDAIEDQIANRNRQSDRLVKLFTDYERYQNQFEGLINKHYYGCYQYTPVQDKDHKDDKFTAPSSAFVSYMKDVFGQAPNENIRARFSGSVNIRKNTIFSPAWTKVYGIPFSAGYGNNKDISEDNFSCIESSPEKLKVFSGRIEEITKNVIQVQSKTGDRYTVHLGGCTKIESVAEKQLPEKGSEIYFKGYERSEKNHYNGYHVTCY